MRKAACSSAASSSGVDRGDHGEQPPGGGRLGRAARRAGARRGAEDAPAQEPGVLQELTDAVVVEVAEPLPVAVGHVVLPEVRVVVARRDVEADDAIEQRVRRADAPPGVAEPRAVFGAAEARVLAAVAVRQLVARVPVAVAAVRVPAPRRGAGRTRRDGAGNPGAAAHEGAAVVDHADRANAAVRPRHGRPPSLVEVQALDDRDRLVEIAAARPRQVAHARGRVKDARRAAHPARDLEPVVDARNGIRAA